MPRTAMAHKKQVQIVQHQKKRYKKSKTGLTYGPKCLCILSSLALAGNGIVVGVRHLKTRGQLLVVNQEEQSDAVTVVTM